MRWIASSRISSCTTCSHGMHSCNHSGRIDTPSTHLLLFCASQTSLWKAHPIGASWNAACWHSQASLMLGHGDLICIAAPIVQVRLKIFNSMRAGASSTDRGGWRQKWRFVAASATPQLSTYPRQVGFIVVARTIYIVCGTTGLWQTHS